MANSLLIVFGIILFALGLFTILLAFAFQNFAIIAVAIVIFIISIVSIVWGSVKKEEKTPPTPPKAKTTIKIERPEAEAEVPVKSGELKTLRYKPIKPTKATILPPNTIYCQYCGKQIPKDSVFCPNCGASLE
ncbi:MAG: zinc ribbon domain-containing protein [Candidatus Jordarchaeum sp.]|uniref:zinc ribbon domain-containing protein n=1 Tax=Candidatus Jordarchaeum sp. TaxID=2823881 RepID=UPI0040491A27